MQRACMLCGVSYDVYFWHHAYEDPANLFDRIAEHDLTAFTPHESVASFRRKVIDTWPDLVDVVEPADDHGTDATWRYMALTLPFAWVDRLTE